MGSCFIRKEPKMPFCTPGTIGLDVSKRTNDQLGTWAIIRTRGRRYIYFTCPDIPFSSKPCGAVNRIPIDGVIFDNRWIGKKIQGVSKIQLRSVVVTKSCHVCRKCGTGAHWFFVDWKDPREARAQ